ncbi:Pyruvate carboxylase [Leucoagaricus sp. SymC.cos]|nr:Pyruvate carboxylase [Leucoagaricus sp. SymC.cos]
MVVPKVLVANRGEIAIRVLRAARELGWLTVALYTTEPGLDASHATYADEVVKLDDSARYMNVATILEIAVHTHCTHVHPGYGFLSESSELANALRSSNVTFIGPSSDALRLAGDKMLSRNLAVSLDVQVAPGDRVLSSNDVRSFAAREGVGYPIMIKALDGGGGRGIRVVKDASEVDEAFKRCMGESPSRQVFAEKALTGWKHIEIQIIGDGTGAVNHCWERECSVQRRHVYSTINAVTLSNAFFVRFQKIVEVAPSRLPRHAIQLLVNASLKIAGHLKYKGLGTFEFLVNASTYQWVFLEINPRVQVEYTITGMTLLSSVANYSNTFSLSSLSLNTPPPIPIFTAIQLRLTAENPENSFLLSSGIINNSELQWPAGHGVRVDTWLSSSPSLPITKWTVGTDFDSLLAKIIVRSDSFDAATQKAQRALCEFSLGPNCKVKTNIEVLAGVLKHQDWKSGIIETFWLERNLKTILHLGKQLVGSRRRGIGGLPNILEQQQLKNDSAKAGGSTPNMSLTTLLQPGSLFHLTLSPATMTSSSQPTSGSQEPKKHTLTFTSIAHNAFPEKLSGVMQSTLSPAPLAFSLSQSTSATVGSGESFELADPNDHQHVAAPITGKIVEIHSALKVSGDGKKRVKMGETLVVLSAMKMETTVVASHDGVVERVGKGLGTGVIFGEGMLVCVVRPSETSRL